MCMCLRAKKPPQDTYARYMRRALCGIICRIHGGAAANFTHGRASGTHLSVVDTKAPRNLLWKDTLAVCRRTASVMVAGWSKAHDAAHLPAVTPMDQRNALSRWG